MTITTTKKLLYSLLGLGIVSSLVYLFLVFTYGLRIPGAQFDNFSSPTSHEIAKENFRIEVLGGFLKQTEHAFTARASSPHFKVMVKGDLIGFPLTIENIHPEATLRTSYPGVVVTEQKNNLQRVVTIQGVFKKPITLEWTFPEKAHYRFMAIGDTGGGSELEWALIRAKQLEVDFVIHLGDIFYSHQDVHSALTTIQNSSVPVFNVYGNHDYHNSDYPEKHTFNKYFAPSNFKFTLLDKTIASLDTASHIFPFHKGKRGPFLNELISKQKTSEQETLLFTHQPIAESMIEEYPDLEHGITGLEGAWLERKLVAITNLTVIAGHVHQSLAIKDALIPTYVAGEGIAHLDLIGNKPVSKLLVGDIYETQPTVFSWALNDIPKQYHTSLKSRYILGSHLRNLVLVENESNNITVDDDLILD